MTIDATKPCAHKQKEKITAFLVSCFAAGVLKLLTGGGFGISALVDWIRILDNSFPDGQGVVLRDWT